MCRHLDELNGYGMMPAPVGAANGQKKSRHLAGCGTGILLEEVEFHPGLLHLGISLALMSPDP